MGKSRQKHRRAAAERAATSAREQEFALGHWPALTGLRGIAAAMVLCFHVYVLAGSPPGVPAALAWLGAIGWSGVDVFFTLSAFLLTLPFVEARMRAAPEPSLRDYWRHRLWRILPAYWVQVPILFLLALAGAKASFWQAPDAASLAVNALFLYDLVPLVPPALPSWWTLPVELGFYLLLPWFARLLTPARWPWLLLVIAASLAWRWWVLHAGFNRAQEIAWAEHLPGRLHQFVIGMLAAWALVRWRQLLAAFTPLQRDLIAVAAVLVFVALPALAIPYSGRPYNGGPMAPLPLLAWHLFAALVVAVLLLALCGGPSRAARLFGAAWLRALGLVSYSLYLWHVPVLLALREALGGYVAVKSAFAPFAFQAILFSLLVAGMAWWLVERPAQQRARRDKISATTARA
jgi:peptidoglycan/LPS O-acetylase OafA/YrhL